MSLGVYCRWLGQALLLHASLSMATPNQWEASLPLKHAWIPYASYDKGLRKAYGDSRRIVTKLRREQDALRARLRQQEETIRLLQESLRQVQREIHFSKFSTFSNSRHPDPHALNPLLGPSFPVHSTPTIIPLRV